MTNRISPIDLKPTLLAVLGTLIATPTEAVEIDDIMPLVCAELGVEEDAWGVVESQKSKPNWVRYNTIRAFRYLKEDGHGEPKGRGKYGLTLEGLEAASLLKAPKKADPETETKAPVETEEGVSWALGDIPEDTYHKDESVREVAISKTPCFGYWAERSPSCKSCPLAGSCKRTAFLAFVEIAEELDTLIGKEIEPEPEIEEKAEEVVEIKKETTEPTKTPDPSTVVPAPCEMACSVCGKTIPAGEKVVWEVDKGKMPLHLSCYS